FNLYVAHSNTSTLRHFNTSLPADLQQELPELVRVVVGESRLLVHDFSRRGNDESRRNDLYLKLFRQPTGDKHREGKLPRGNVFFYFLQVSFPIDRQHDKLY